MPTYRYETLFGLKTLVLENDLLRVRILLSRGADIYELVYKPLEADILMKTPVKLEAYAGRDLARERLTYYAEMYPGGWQELCPIFVEEVPGGGQGESATLPWDCEIAEEGKYLSARCTVDLPVTPLSMEKVFTLCPEGALRISERIVSRADRQLRFSINHHPAFGAPLVCAGAEVTLPPCKAFDYASYCEHPERPLADYEHPVEAAKVRGETWDLTKAHGPEEDWNLFLTLKRCEEGRAAIRNPHSGLTMTLTWDLAAYPHLAYWTSTDNGQYTLALEPSRSYLIGGEHAIPNGEYCQLGPGEELRTWVKCQVGVQARRN